MKLIIAVKSLKVKVPAKAGTKDKLIFNSDAV